LKGNRNPNRTKWEKPKTTSYIKTEKLPAFFKKIENQVLKMKNLPTATNTKTERLKSFGTKTENPI